MLYPYIYHQILSGREQPFGGQGNVPEDWNEAQGKQPRLST